MRLGGYTHATVECAFCRGMEFLSHTGEGNVGIADKEPLLEVAQRLLHEGLSRIDKDVESAIVALRQSFALEREYGDDGGRLCRACAGYCRALARASDPRPPASAVTPLLQALDTLAVRREREPQSKAEGFITAELIGLAQRLVGLGHVLSADGVASPRAGAGHDLRPAGLEELRAADKAFERLVELSGASSGSWLAEKGLPLEGIDLSLTQQELLFQQAVTAQRIGRAMMATGDARESDAATFYLHRAVSRARTSRRTKARARRALSDSQVDARIECKTPSVVMLKALTSSTECARFTFVLPSLQRNWNNPAASANLMASTSKSSLLASARTRRAV